MSLQKFENSKIEFHNSNKILIIFGNTLVFDTLRSEVRGVQNVSQKNAKNFGYFETKTEK